MEADSSQQQSMFKTVELNKKVKIVAMSDTHDIHYKINMQALPDADIFIHAGDFTKYSRPKQLENFRQFLKRLPYKHKIVIAGNHDFVFDRQNYTKGRNFQKFKHKQINPPMNPEQEIKKLKEHFQIDGIRIFGSPYSPQFYDWGFMYSEANSQALWSTLPKEIDVLITHGPPYGILDLTVNKIKAGCKGLLKMVQILNPQFHVFGHIHQAYGQKKINQTTFINASNVNFAYKLTNQPIVFQVQKKNRINIEDGKQVKIAYVTKKQQELKQI